MATIIKDYVSFETAKLLKEKGMDISCFNHYVQKNNNDGTSEAVTVCTLQMAMKWLRVVHNILLFLLPAQDNGKLFYLVEVWTWNEEESIYESTYAPMPRKEPGQAVEAAIKYCLENLI